MEKELHETYSYLVADPKRAELVEAADELILAFRRNPKLFVLPKTYKWATALIEHFAYDLEGWTNFVRQIVDEFPKRSEERRPIQIVYRKLNTRHDASIRRERLKRALKKYVEVHGDFESASQARDYERLLFQSWSAARKNVLIKLRLESDSGKATAEERRDACDKFWAEIREQIDAGNIPSLTEVIILRDEAIKLSSLYGEDSEE